MKDLVIDVGRIQGDERYEINLKNENGMILAGFAGTGKTNFLNYMKSQILQHDDVKMSIFSSRVTRFDNILTESFGEDKVKSFIRNKKARVEVKKYVKEIDSRLKRINKSKCDYETYLSNYEKEDKDKLKYHFIFIDDLSIELFNMRCSDINQFNEYINNLKYILEEGSKVGFFLIISGYRCKNGDLPDILADSVSCKISFKNPKIDYFDWNLILDGMKTPNRVGECLILSNSIKNEEGYATLVKSYLIDKAINERKYIFENNKIFSCFLR